MTFSKVPNLSELQFNPLEYRAVVKIKQVNSCKCLDHCKCSLLLLHLCLGRLFLNPCWEAWLRLGKEDCIASLLTSDFMFQPQLIHLECGLNDPHSRVGF